MKNIKTTVIALHIFYLLSTQSAYAVRPAMSLSCLVNQSNLILFSEVLSISENPIIEDEFSPIHSVEIKIDRAIKGEPELQGKPTKKLFFTLRLNVTEQASVKIGHHYLFFIKNSEAGPHILNGGQGAIEVNKGKLIEIEPGSTRELDTFITEINKAKKQTCPEQSID